MQGRIPQANAALAPTATGVAALAASMVDKLPVIPGSKYLAFRCTGCGNCCRDPLLPLTHIDLQMIVERTRDYPEDVVRWVDKWGIDMDDEPEGFVELRQGKRVMVLRHEHGACRYLGDDNRCTIYKSRPLGCRIYPFDPEYRKRGPEQGQLRRLKLIHACECPHELDGDTDVARLRRLHERYEGTLHAYHDKVEEWNRLQKRRRRNGLSPRTGPEFLRWLGFSTRSVGLQDAAE
jgi:Fe-S-cluster containining protein